MSFFFSFNLILPELSTELRARGGADYVGWIIPAFSISALIARPFSGWITDNLGRKWAMIGGCLFCIVAGCFYPWVSTVTGFLVVRAIHGFSTGFTPTGFTAFTADIVQESHRGRAMGWQGMFNNLGTTIGYALGALIALHWGIDWMYYISAALAATAWMLFMSLPETRKPAQKRIPIQIGQFVLLARLETQRHHATGLRILGFHPHRDVGLHTGIGLHKQRPVLEHLYWYIALVSIGEWANQ